MLHMKLLHHFNHVTAETLIFGPSIWRGDVMNLALQASAVLVLAHSWR
jgi:hypothetical protein